MRYNLEHILFAAVVPNHGRPRISGPAHSTMRVRACQCHAHTNAHTCTRARDQHTRRGGGGGPSSRPRHPSCATISTCVYDSSIAPSVNTLCALSGLQRQDVHFLGRGGGSSVAARGGESSLQQAECTISASSASKKYVLIERLECASSASKKHFLIERLQQFGTDWAGQRGRLATSPRARMSISFARFRFRLSCLPNENGTKRERPGPARTQATSITTTVLHPGMGIFAAVELLTQPAGAVIIFRHC